MNTVSKILSISLLLSCIHISAMDPAAAPANPEQRAALAALSAKIQNTDAALAQRRASFDGLHNKTTELARIIAAKESAIEQAHAHNTAAINAADKVFGLASQRYDKALEIYMRALNTFKFAQDLHASTIATENNTYTETVAALKAEIQTISTEIQTLEQALTAKQAEITAQETKRADYTQRFDRVLKGLPEKDGVFARVLGLFTSGAAASTEQPSS